jgi:tetratricopeptide (TPR) repeat protein
MVGSDQELIAKISQAIDYATLEGQSSRLIESLKQHEVGSAAFIENIETILDLLVEQQKLSNALEIAQYLNEPKLFSFVGDDAAKVRIMYKVGSVLAKSGKLDVAISAYDKAIEVSHHLPFNERGREVDVWVNLADLHINQGDFRRAEVCLLSANKLAHQIYGYYHPRFADLSFHFGRLYLQWEKLTAARKAVEKGIWIYRSLELGESVGLASLLCLHGRISAMAGEYAVAREDFGEAHRILAVLPQDSIERKWIAREIQRASVRINHQ